MADDTTIPSGARVAADELATLNGAATSADGNGRLPQAQRVKPGFGGDGVFQDVEAAHPLPVTDATLTAAIVTLATYVDGLEASTSPLHADLAAVLAKLTADPATATAQASQATKLDTVHTDLASILAKLIASPATEATLAAIQALLMTQASYLDGLEANTTGIATATAQATQATKLDTVHTDLASILAKLIASPATEATLAAAKTDLDNLLAAGAGDVASTLTDGRKTVTTPATAVALRASLACKWVTVTALKTNTDQVNVGASGVLATSGGSTGTPLAAGQAMTIPVSNANLVFVDARVAGEGVSFTVGS